MTQSRLRRVPPGTIPASASARTPAGNGTAATSISASTPDAAAILARCPSSPNPVTSVAPVAPAATAARAAGPLLAVIDATAAAWSVVGRRAPLDRRRGHPDAERLGQHERVAVAQAGVGEDRVGCHLADDGQAVLGLGVVDAVAADHHEAALRPDVRAARQHLAEQRERQLVARPRHEVQREQRPPAHRVDVRHRVLRRDPAPRAGVVDDGGDEVGGHHQRARSVQPPDGRVVTGVGADEEVRMAGRGQRAQDLRELVGGELAGSTGAVAELGEAAGRDGVDHDRTLRP